MIRLILLIIFLASGSLCQASSAVSDSTDSVDNANINTDNIGLTIIKDNEQLIVSARSLLNGEPKPDINIRLIGMDKQILEQNTSDNRGLAYFTTSHDVKEVIASQGDKQLAVFDAIQIDEAKYTLFTYFNKAYYHAGMPIHIIALLRDKNGIAIEGIPLTASILRPDSTEVSRQVIQSVGQGGYQLDWILPLMASDGNWSVIWYDNGATPLAKIQIAVNNNFSNHALTLTPHMQSSSLDVSIAENEAAGHINKAWLKISTDERPFIDYPEFHFGVSKEPIIKTTTGRTSLSFALPYWQHRPLTPMIAQIDVNSYALNQQLVASGSVKIPIHNQPLWLGAKAEPVTSGAKISLIALNEQGQAVEGKNIDWKLLKEEPNIEWFLSGDSWHYRNIVHDKLIDNGNINIAIKGHVLNFTNIENGNYRLELRAGGVSALTILSFSTDEGGRVICRQ